jgi:Flp pilus assembly protein TadD
VKSGVLTPREGLLEKAAGLADRGALTEALAVVRQILEGSPLSPEAYLLSAQIQHSLGQPAVAIDELKRAIYLDPSNAEAQLRLGFLLSEQGSKSGALRAFRAAAALASALEAPEPEEVELRETAAAQMVRLMKETHT